MNGIDFLKNFVGILIVILFIIMPILGWVDKHFHTLLIFIVLIILNSSLKFEIKAKQFYAASQRVL